MIKFGYAQGTSFLLMIIAGLTSCDPDMPGPLTGQWSGRVLLLAPSGVPSVDSAAASTLTLDLRQAEERLDGSVTGLEYSPAAIAGVSSRDSILMSFYIGGGDDPGLALGGFAGRTATDSLVGEFRRPVPGGMPRPMTLRRL